MWTSEELEILQEFVRTMEEEVIPQIENDIRMREELAQEGG